MNMRIDDDRPPHRPTIRERVLHALRGRTWLRGDTIAAGLGQQVPAVQRNLRRLESDGIVERRRAADGSAQSEWRLLPEVTT